MHTFLTPDPITLEIRNAAGEIRVDLADVATTTVDVVASPSHPLGFLDDVFRAVAAKAQSVGDRKAFTGGRPRFDPPRFDRPGFDRPGFGGGDDSVEDPTERVRVDFRGAANGTDGAGADGGGTAGRAAGATLIVDTDPARDGWKSSFTIHVTAPSGSGVRIQTQSADVTVTGRSEKLETRTASGDVKVDEIVGRSVVQTASGDVTVGSTAECDIRTASGDIEVHSVSSDAVVHSTSGDIRLDSAAGNINARSVSGDIRVLDAASGRAEVVTVSGDVEIGIHAGSLTAVDLSTVSGTTDTDFEVSDEAPRADDAADGADDEPILDLRVKTTSGDIRLRRSVAA